MNGTLITEAGLLRLCQELDYLKTKGRRKAAERLRNARSSGAGPSGTADYVAARDEEARLEARIARLEERLAAARLVAPNATNQRVRDVLL
jgi:transcription elongation factor GreA